MNGHSGRKNVPLECRLPVETDLEAKMQIPEIVDSIMQSCREQKGIQHLDATIMPNREAVISLLADIEALMFPGYIGRNEVESANLVYYIGELTNKIFKELSVQIMRCIRHECVRKDDGMCRHCIANSQEYTLQFLRRVPEIRDFLSDDINAAFDGDPAAKGVDEIIFAYPGVKAITVYRIAHVLHDLKIPILPRIMTEYAHTITGVDIHPAAKIGRRFFIDHGTGVVVGETTTIGNNVQIYQGVTLGALRLPKNAQGELDRSAKRHPTIEDNVTIYAGATILGGETVIGEGSIVGGNIWLTNSIPPGSKIVNMPAKMDIRKRNADKSDDLDYYI